MEVKMGLKSMVEQEVLYLPSANQSQGGRKVLSS